MGQLLVGTRKALNVIITAMDWWTPDGGTLLEWHPTAHARRHAAAAPDDSGPLSFLQENHIRACHAARQSGVDHTAYLGSGTDVDGDLDSDALTRALRTFVLRHEGLRTWFDTDGVEVTRHLLDWEAVDFEVTVAGQFTESGQFREYLHGRFEREAVATSWPGFAFGAISRPGGFTLYYGCDHALSDGASQALALAEIAELYDSEITGNAPADFASAPTGSFLEYARLENHLAASCDPGSPAVVEWLDIFESHGGAMPGFPLDMGLEPGETAPVRPIELDLLDAGGIARFDRVCRDAGGTFLSGIYAAVAITEYELADRTDYFGISVLATRLLADFGMSQGWFCNFAPVAFPVAGAGAFTDLIPAALAGYTRAKRLAAVPAQSVIAALLGSGADPADVTASPNLLSYIDFRRFPGHGGQAYDRGVLFTGEGRTANASMWFNRDDDRLYLGSQTPDTTLAQLQIKRYHEHLWSVFDRVVVDGDYPVPGPQPTGVQGEQMRLP